MRLEWSGTLAPDLFKQVATPGLECLETKVSLRRIARSHPVPNRMLIWCTTASLGEFPKISWEF